MEIDLSVLRQVGRDLAGAANDIYALAATVPTGIDAGPMTVVINPLVAEVVASADEIAKGLQATGTVVANSVVYYEAADADVEASLDQITRLVEDL
ncbi:MAG: hypothetical protein ACK5LN_09740 [Propioniciclava sp.]